MHTIRTRCNKASHVCQLGAWAVSSSHDQNPKSSHAKVIWDSWPTVNSEARKTSELCE